MITAFVGLPLPRDVADVLEKAQGGLHAGEMVPRECFFITVADLGDVDEGRLSDIRRALGEVRVGPFYMNVAGVNTLGGNKPRVVYAGTDKPSGLKNLHNQIMREVRKAGLPLEHQQFEPHIAIAEFDELGAMDLRQIMSFLSRREALAAGPFPVTDLQLIVIRDTRDGVVQEVVETWPLSL